MQTFARKLTPLALVAQLDRASVVETEKRISSEILPNHPLSSDADVYLVCGRLLAKGIAALMLPGMRRFATKTPNDPKLSDRRSGSAWLSGALSVAG